MVSYNISTPQQVYDTSTGSGGALSWRVSVSCDISQSLVKITAVDRCGEVSEVASTSIDVVLSECNINIVSWFIDARMLPQAKYRPPFWYASKGNIHVP